LYCVELVRGRFIHVNVYRVACAEEEAAAHWEYCLEDNVPARVGLDKCDHIGDEPNPLAVTVPLIMRYAWDQVEVVTPPFVFETVIEDGLLLL